MLKQLREGIRVEYIIVKSERDVIGARLHKSFKFGNRRQTDIVWMTQAAHPAVLAHEFRNLIGGAVSARVVDDNQLDIVQCLAKNRLYGFPK